MRRCSFVFCCVLLVAVGTATSAAVPWKQINRQSESWYATTEAAAIARSVLLYQTESGGWPKNRDMTAPPDAAFLAEKKFDHRAPTIDNDATTTQIEFLARVVTAHDNAPCREAVLRSLDYLLVAQYSNGGWPQYFPLIPGYYTHITYNDDAIVNALVVLREVSAGAPPYAFVDAARRAKATDAVKRGVACILRTQIKQQGKLTVWCAQHDETTFEPAWARNFEPPSLSGGESVGIVRFLMEIENPPPEVKNAIEGAIDWFKRVKIHGLRVDNSPGPDGKKDRHAVADPHARELWARFYELDTNKPIFVGRDKIIRYDFNEIERERRTGYNYLNDGPAKLLSHDYPRWQARNHLQ